MAGPTACVPTCYIWNNSTLAWSSDASVVSTTTLATAAYAYPSAAAGSIGVTCVVYGAAFNGGAYVTVAVLDSFVAPPPVVVAPTATVRTSHTQ